MPEARVSVTQKQYVAIHNPKMYPYTKFWIPTSHNTDIVWTDSTYLEL